MLKYTIIHHKHTYTNHLNLLSLSTLQPKTKFKHNHSLKLKLIFNILIHARLKPLSSIYNQLL